MVWTSADIAAATGGVASADFPATGVTFDSREVGAGYLFIALTGETTDGHRFVDGAFGNGAAGAVVSRPIPQPHVLVADTMSALNALGVAARARTNATIIGVTGSVGKTGTKEVLAAALARDGSPTHRSVKSYNNHTGVPLSLARMPPGSRFGVFEMGMNHAGEIAALTRLVRPHVALITAIAPAHIGNFANGEEGIADAKAEIFQGLEPGGTAIIPFDTPYCDRLRGGAEPYAARIVTFGMGEGADVRALETMEAPAGGTFVTARVGARELSFTVAAAGAHWVGNALAVLAAVEAAGGDLGRAGLALGEMPGLPGRGERLTIALPGGAATLIDESYNANPGSMRATLKVLAQQAGRRIAVLGEMREMGAESARYHAELAGPVDEAGLAHAILVGEAMLPLARALEGVTDFVHVPDAAAARDRLLATIAPGDAVLVKGSNGVGLAAVVAAAKAIGAEGVGAAG